MEGVHVVISGKVQGVWFRASTRNQALGLGLTGWVRNLRDGRVEAHAEGPRERLLDLVDWCKDGPELAFVTDVQVTWVPATGELIGFELR